MSSSVHTATVGLTQLIRPEISNEVRANYSNHRIGINYVMDDFGGAAAAFPIRLCSRLVSPPPMALSYSSSWVLGNTCRAKQGTNEQRQINLVDNLSVTKGGHQLKFGVDYRWLAPFSSPAAYHQFAQFSGVTATPGGALSGTALFAQSVHLSNQRALVAKFLRLWPGHLEDHTSINRDLWLEVGHQSGAEGQECGQRSIYRDWLEQSSDDDIGPSRHAALPNDLRKYRAENRSSLINFARARTGRRLSAPASESFMILDRDRSEESPASFRTLPTRTFSPRRFR